MKKILKHVKTLLARDFNFSPHVFRPLNHPVLKAIGVLTFVVGVSSCTQKAVQNGNENETKANKHQTPAHLLVKAPHEVSVMTFNVENLFDTTHDQGTDDYTYLPLAVKKTSPEAQAACAKVSNSFYKTECYEKDWSDANLEFKLSQIEKVIKYIENGQGPDIITMAEVENLNVLNRLTDKNLKGLGYQTRLLVEGPDTRGIDPAILSKFPLKGKPKLHIIPYKDSDPEQLKRAQKSRGILEATLLLPNNKTVTVLAAHLPSQANPTEWRAQAIQFIKARFKEANDKNEGLIIGGDFNIIDLEDRSEGFFSKELASVGQVSHLVGCKNCEGSHNHKGEWSFLDVLVFNQKIKEGSKLELIPDSIQVVKTPDHLKRNGTPLRFNEDKKEGVSDHFPLYSRLKILE